MEWMEVEPSVGSTATAPCVGRPAPGTSLLSRCLTLTDRLSGTVACCGDGELLGHALLYCLPMYVKSDWLLYTTVHALAFAFIR